MTIAWYELPADTLLSGAFTLSAEAGSAGTAKAFGIWNNRSGAGASTEGDVRLEVLAQVTDPDTLETVWRSEGVPVLDDHEVEGRIVQGLNQAILASEWTPLGRWRLLSLPDLANDTGVQVELQLRPTSDSESDAVRLAFRVYSRASTPVSEGFTESAGPDGIVSGLGDGTRRELVTFGGLAENPGGADDQVEIGDLVWTGAGVPRAKLAHLVQLDANDGAAEALQSGEGYYAALSAKDDGTITDTRGARSASPVKPTPPTDEILLGWVLREFDGLINDADIEIVGRESLFAWSASGTAFSTGPGVARVDNRVIRNTGTRSVTLDANDTSQVWLLADGNLQATTDGSRPADRALLLYEATTDATDVVLPVVDHRVFIGGRLERVEIPIAKTGGLAGGETGFSVWPHPVAGNLRPVASIALSLDDTGDTPTAGQTRVDILASDAGGAFASLFPGADRYPEVAWDDADPVDRDALPTKRGIGPWSRLKAEVLTVPTATTTPAALRVIMLVEVS